jgi:Tol biopolymer transport system component
VIGPAMLAFVSNRGGSGSYDIWRMETDGTDPQIALNTPLLDELFPDLLRGTRDKIAYAAEGGAPATWNVWTMTVDGLHAVQLTTQTQSKQLEPSWSRDGSKIAYASNTAQPPSTTTWELWTMTATGTSQAKLTVQSPSWAVAPCYSPVSNDILFVSNKSASGGSGVWLWDDSAAGPDKAMELYDSAGQDGAASPAGFPAGLGVALGLPAGIGISKPAWSPDGTKIAFSTDQGGNIDLYVMNANGTSPKTLQAYVEGLLGQSAGTYPAITTTDDEFCPYWLEDGTGLAFVKKVGTAYNLYKVSFVTGAVTPLTLAGSGANLSPAGKK